jgi:serine/threonine protein kinase
VTAQVIQRDRLGVLTKIGQGGQGVVYGAPHVKTKFAASMVFKEYRAQALADIDFTALAAMPALVKDSLSSWQAEELVSVAAWPCALVETAGAATGFVMPDIPEEFFIPLTTANGVSNTPAEFQHLLSDSSVLAARGITIDDAQRYALLREVASGLAFLHRHGVCVGDISPKNLLFSLSPHPAAYFIDCDAMRINGVSVLPQVETPGWQVPAGEELATVYSDAYKLGLLALRLLAGDHDTTNLEHLPSTTPGLLHSVITETLTNPPHGRPLPEAWTYVLGYAVEHAQHLEKAAATIAAVPAGAAPDAPAKPVVHSRPAAPSAHSAPPGEEPSTRANNPPTDSRPSPWAAVAVAGLAIVLAAMVVISLALAKHHSGAPHQPSTPAHSAPPSEPILQPGPPSQLYVKTPWGTRCQVGTDQIICDTCEPGLLLDTPAGENCPGPSLNEIAVDASGTKKTPDAGVILPASPSIQQLNDGQTLNINGWTIAVSGWVRFTNDATGHGMAVAAQNEESF